MHEYSHAVIVLPVYLYDRNIILYTEDDGEDLLEIRMNQ